MLGIARLHFRLNSAQLHNAIRSEIRLDAAPGQSQQRRHFLAEVTRLLDEHVARRQDNSRLLWGLLAFTLWYEHHVEQEPPLLRSARMEALLV